MTAIQPASVGRALHRRVGSIDAISRLNWKTVHAALWERQLAPTVLASFRRLTHGQAFALQSHLDPRSDNPARLVQGLPKIVPWLGQGPIVGDEVARAELAADLVVLCAALGHATGRWQQRVKISVVDHEACPKFHVDNVPLRVVCSYVGNGTEYVPEPAVDRAALKRAGDEAWPPERANRSICRRPELVVHPAPGDVLWLRGEKFDGANTPGAVHRSPAGAPSRRLVLTIDVV